MNSDNLYLRIVHFIDVFHEKGSVNKKESVYLQNLTKIILIIKILRLWQGILQE